MVPLTGTGLLSTLEAEECVSASGLNVTLLAAFDVGWFAFFPREIADIICPLLVANAGRSGTGMKHAVGGVQSVMLRCLPTCTGAVTVRRRRPIRMLIFLRI
jgi:hypothetical protein